MVGGAGPGQIQLQFKNYVKSGDQMTFNFDSATKALTAVNVNSYLNDPKDAVTLAGDIPVAAGRHELRGQHGAERSGQEHPGQHDERELPEARDVAASAYHRNR